MMAGVGKRKMGPWSYRQQRELIKLAAASKSLETIANRMGRPTTTILKQAARLGISIKRQKAKR
jgi:division protein CdvB (Snf7/Vps24/ESCRT-III family)